MDGRSKVVSLKSERTIGSAPAFKSALRLAKRAASGHGAILIIGPTGSGKSHIARYIHSSGPMAAGPFIEWNAGTGPEELFEAELFGVASGTATGVAGRPGILETAAGGILCLSGLELLNSAHQAALLRIMDERLFSRVGDNRLLSFKATPIAMFDRWPEDLVKEGLLREDLLFRFDIIRIILPPLSERREDIPALAEHFLRTACRRHNRPVPSMSPGLIKALEKAAWPGNLRELQQRMEGLLLTGNAYITPDDLPANFWLSGPPVESGLNRKMTLAELKDAYIRSVLAECGGNRTRAASLLGISRKTLWEHLKRRPV